MTSRPEWSGSRKENFSNTITLLRDIADAMEESINGDEGFNAACRRRNLDSFMIRRILKTKTITQCRYGTALADEIPDEPDFYERFYRKIFGDDIVTETRLPDDYMETVDYVMDRLPERDQQLISCLLGRDREPMTYKETGAKLGLTKQRIDQLEQKAYHRIRYGENRRVLKYGLSEYIKYKKQNELLADYMDKQPQPGIAADIARNAYMNLPVTELDLPACTVLALQKNGIDTIGSFITADADTLNDMDMEYMNDILNQADAARQNALDMDEIQCDKLRKQFLQADIGGLKLSRRTHKALVEHGICTVGGLMESDEKQLENFEGIGTLSMDEIMLTKRMLKRRLRLMPKK